MVHYKQDFRPLKRARTELVFILLAAMLSSHGYAQEERTFVNPGIKLGYTFGDSRGFTFGIECSVTRLLEGYSYGAVAAIDLCKQMQRFHLGVEASRGIGIEWGPSVIAEGGVTQVGHTLTPFMGIIVYPYYAVTFRSRGDNLQEVGSYFKFPIQTAGRSFSLGG